MVIRIPAMNLLGLWPCRYYLPGDTYFTRRTVIELTTASESVESSVISTRGRLMATQKKPAAPTRKKTTKRGPTKAAALKALGLTQEDLNTLKTLAELREQNAEQRAKEPTPVEEPAAD